MAAMANVIGFMVKMGKRSVFTAHKIHGEVVHL